ncbi:glutathione S-transferase [Protomyces lactucae-debilis]|uniref:Glutathione S-transferase n=1 Tax=Protomyces lactucae-debilis TaxID=2754530 RepID=A0A1Y2FBH2_PROLT|nr:glutathione S-transferase [Protomyces lactucae-debilis]ORY80967.1 glutathione S-transferase [Protomyces lactucae-debilis]
MAEPILYSYDFSPYAFKVRSVLSLLNIKYKVVQVDMVMPRPELEAIGVNYRRIPILAVGKNIYCDSQSIIEYLLSREDARSIVPAGSETSQLGLKVLGDLIFRTTLSTMDPSGSPPAFIKDRASVFPILASGTLEKDPSIREHAIAEVQSLFTAIQDTFCSNGKKWALGGDAPSLADAHVAWAVRFVIKGIKLDQKEKVLSKEALPRLHDWLERFEQALDLNTPTLTGDEAKKVVFDAASPTTQGLGVQNGLGGFQKNQKVSVSQSDADPTHPVDGQLLALDAKELVVALDNGLHIHFPRLGSKLSKL